LTLLLLPHLPIIIIYIAKANAPPTANTSPYPMPPEADEDIAIMYKPTRARIQAIQTLVCTLFLNKTSLKIGTSNTSIPAMNAALDDVVYFKHTVCKLIAVTKGMEAKLHISVF